MKKFYPLLLAMFPVIFLYSQNMEEVSLADTPIPLLILVAGTLLFMLLLRIFIKNWNKIALLTSCYLAISFLYTPVRDLLPSLTIVGSLRNTILWASLWFLLYAIPTFFILRSRRNFSVVTKFLGIVAVALVVFSLANIGINQIGMSKATSDKADEELIHTGDKPDIYYIILDEYVRDDALKEIYDYDNELTAYLTSKGFYVATESRSNFWMSVPSLACSLSMEHIDEPNLTYIEKLRMMQNSKVSQFLKSMGYQYIFVTSGALEAGIDKYAELRLPQQYLFGVKISRFSIYLIQSTTLCPLLLNSIGHNWRESILYCFDEIPKIPDIEAPTFTFAHIVSPHTPFIFDCDCHPIGPIAHVTSLEGHREKYLDQLKCVNKKVEALVEEILSKSDTPPIIIIQGDHGLRHVDEDKKWRNANLNAYYLPDGGDQLLYPTITPVNSFRVVFNYYFGTNYELLEDRTDEKAKR